jgi:signal peptidase I
MAPRIDPGDVVVSAPLALGQGVPLGRVVVFTTPPSHDGSPTRTVVHRVVTDSADGTYVTAGDANPAEDTTPLVRERVLGQARLLVPYVGLPTVWIGAQAWPALLAWLVLTAAAVTISAITPKRPPAPSAPGPPDGSGNPPAADSGVAAVDRVRHALAPAARSTASVALLRAGVVTLALVLAAGLVVQVASAAFSADTRSSGNDWASRTRLLLGYPKAVLTDNPWGFYLLDEASGPTAADLSGNASRSGTYTGNLTYRQSGSGTGSPGTSVLLGGGGARMVTGGSAIAGPTTFTLEVWMKSTSTTGGKLIGFESTQASTSSKYDRHLFMRNNGLIVYGGWTGGTQRLIVTPRAYNDGVWHLVVVTARPNGSNQTSTIYVDGTAVVTGTTTQLSTYTGWWRAGYGALATGSNYPSSADFEGSLDNVAVYAAELSAARVLAHYNAR